MNIEDSIVDAMHQAGMGAAIVNDMEELHLRVEYHQLLKDHNKPLPLPFEQWAKERRHA